MQAMPVRAELPTPRVSAKLCAEAGSGPTEARSFLRRWMKQGHLFSCQASTCSNRFIALVSQLRCSPRRPSPGATLQAVAQQRRGSWEH